MAVIRTGARLVVVGAAVVTLAACGSTDSTSASDNDSASTGSTGSTTPSPSSTATTPAGPACDEVWQEGADLPAGYRGCVAGDETVDAEQIDCSSGQFIVVYDDRFWAVRGHVIGSAPDGLDQSAAYRRVLYSCRA